MFESIREQAPELARLQATVTNLEQEAHEAASRVGQLQAEAEGAREDDLNNAALAHIRGRKPPKAREPEVRAKIPGASQRAEMLQRSLAMAQSDLAGYTSEHAEHLDQLLLQAQADNVRSTSELAAPVADELNTYQLIDADRRALRPYLQAPARENSGEPQDSVYFIGPVNRSNIGGERIGGERIGRVEALMRELAGWAARYRQGDATIVGPTPEESGEGAA